MCSEKKVSRGVCRNPIWSICFRRNEAATLFVPQRFNWVEVGRLISGVSSENNSDDGADTEADDDPINRDDRRQFQEIGSGISTENSQHDSHGSSDFT